MRGPRRRMMPLIVIGQQSRVDQRDLDSRIHVAARDSLKDDHPSGRESDDSLPAVDWPSIHGVESGRRG